MSVNSINNVSQVGFKGVEAQQELNKQIPEIKPDSFEKQGDESTKTKSKTPLIIGLAALGAAAIGLGVAYKTGKLKLPSFKKGAEEMADTTKKGTEEIKEEVDDAFDLLKSKFAKNKEELVIPKGGYDMTKETGEIGCATNTKFTGFSAHLTDPSNQGINGNRLNLGFGLTKDGKSYVHTGYQALGCPIGVAKEFDDEVLSSITIVGKDSKFTPAQKNLIALTRQGKMDSPNSPIGKACTGKNMTPEQLYEMIAKWSQDIDVDHQETQIILGNFDKHYNKDKSLYDFFKTLHLDTVLDKWTESCK